MTTDRTTLAAEIDEQAEAVATSLEDDAAKLKEEGGWPGEECANNMVEAARWIRYYAADYFRLLREKQVRLDQPCMQHDMQRDDGKEWTKCVKCGTHGGWYCPSDDNPSNECAYNSGDENCLYCGQPEERK